MAQRQLTLEEANKLCIEALVLLSRQNRSRKQKKLTFPSSSPVPPKNKQHFCQHSPCGAETKADHLDSSPPEFQLIPERSPPKHDHWIHCPSSLRKDSSLENLCQVYGESGPKVPSKENIPVFSGQLPQSPPRLKDHRIWSKAQFQTSGKLSQISMDIEPQLYSEYQVKDLKRDLEIRSGGKICRTQEISLETGRIVGYHLYCKSDLECPYHCFLQLCGTDPAKGESLYRFIPDCEQHLKECLEDEQELTFLKLTKQIDSMEGAIRHLLEEKEELKPKDILGSMAGELGHSDHRFIYAGLNCKNYHKAAKKYFDNLVYKIKNPLWS